MTFPARPTILMLVLLALGAVLAGCATVGPRAIQAGRFDYNEAIVRTWNEQLLLNLVRLRYRDTPFFLEVSSVSTQYELRAGGGLGATFNVDGAGGTESGAEASGVYVERPTVTYAPLQGQAFARRLLAGIPLESLLILSESGWSLERILRIGVQRVNDIPNAPRASGPTPATPPRFERFRTLARLLRELQLAGAISLYQSAETRSATMTVNPRASGGERLAQLQDLLGLQAGATDIPINAPVGEAKRSRGIYLAPRSLMGTMFYLSQGVEPPAAHERAGRVTVTRSASGEVFDWGRVVGDLFRVRSGPKRPTEAFVAVRYRGWWFWIADDDLDSKSTFGLLGELFRLQAGSESTASPVLTLPLGP